MGPVRIAIVVIAGVAAIALAFLVQRMMAPKPAATPAVATAPAKPVTRVLVAKKDLPVGWRITPADLTWQDWPVDALNASFVTDGSAPAPAPAGADKVVKKAGEAAADLVKSQGPMQAFDGAMIKEAVLAGEPITARKVVRAGETGYMAVVLQPGMRAMAIPITAETGAGGFILPGDRVDVLQAKAADSGKGFVTETMLRNIRVLAIDQATAPAEDAKTVVGAVATLEVAAGDAEVLARGKAQGEMILSLRSYADIGGPSGRGGGPAGSAQTVRISRAGEITEVAVR